MMEEFSTREIKDFHSLLLGSMRILPFQVKYYICQEQQKQKKLTSQHSYLKLHKNVTTGFNLPLFECLFSTIVTKKNYSIF